MRKFPRLQTFQKSYLFYMYMYVCVRLSVCVSHVHRNPWRMEEESDTLKLELQGSMSCHACAGSQAQVRTSNKPFLTANYRLYKQSEHGECSVVKREHWLFYTGQLINTTGPAPRESLCLPASIFYLCTHMWAYTFKDTQTKFKKLKKF